MPQNKKQSVVYTIMMCAVMVMWMSVYNVSLNMGRVSTTALVAALAGFPMGYVVGMICDWFVVSGPAKRFAFRFLASEDSTPRRKIVAISCSMVIGMVTLMSLYGALEVAAQSGFSAGATGVLGTWLHNIPLNLVMALPFQLLVAGPVVRRLFSKIAPALA